MKLRLQILSVDFWKDPQKWKKLEKEELSEFLSFFPASSRFRPQQWRVIVWTIIKTTKLIYLKAFFPDPTFP